MLRYNLSAPSCKVSAHYGSWRRRYEAIFAGLHVHYTGREQIWTNHSICYKCSKTLLGRENASNQVVATLNFLTGEGVDYYPDQSIEVLISDYFDSALSA